jgi:hypothetical protein
VDVSEFAFVEIFALHSVEQKLAATRWVLFYNVAVRPAIGQGRALQQLTALRKIVSRVVLRAQYAIIGNFSTGTIVEIERIYDSLCQDVIS